MISLVFLFFTLKAQAGFFSDFTSPLTTDAKYFTIPGMVVTYGITAFEDQKLSNEAKTELYIEATEKQRKYAHYGDFLGNGVLNGTYFLVQVFAGNYDNAWHMFNATLHTSIVTWLMKYTFHERRPSGSNYFSFPSGHTSNTFAFASVAAINHSWPVGLISIGIASFVGYSRIVDNAHWLHDVVGGMVIGASYGIGIYLNRSGVSSNISFNLIPIPKSKIPGLLFSYKF